MAVGERGSIHNEKAYALGKMLDHSAWQRGEKIVRLITPSDIDACFDNNGRILYCEFSYTETRWSDLSVGQRRLYENSIKGGPHCAVLCKHAVAPQEERAIDSRADVTHFQVMFYDQGFVVSEVIKGKHWSPFVMRWFEDSLRLRRIFLGKAAGLVSARSPAGATALNASPEWGPA